MIFKNMFIPKTVSIAVVLIFICQQMGLTDSASLRPLAAKDKKNKKKSLWSISAGSSQGLPPSTEDINEEADRQAYRLWRDGIGPHPAHEENMQEVAEFIGWYTDNAIGPINESIKIDMLYSLFEGHGGSFRRDVVKRIEGHEVIEDVFFTTLCDVFGRTYMISPTKELRESVSINRIMMHFLEGYVVKDPRRLNTPQTMETLYKRFKTTFWCPGFSESAFLKLLDSVLPPDYLLDRETGRPLIRTITLSDVPIARRLSLVLEEAEDTEPEEREGTILVLGDEEIGIRSTKAHVIADILSKYGPYIPSGQTARNQIAYALLELSPEMDDAQIKLQALIVRQWLQVPEKARPEGENLGLVAGLMADEAITGFGEYLRAPVAEPKAADIEPPTPDPLTEI